MLAEFERIAKSTRAERVRLPDLARASRSAGHGHVIATGSCLLLIDKLSRAVLKLTTESNHESRKRSNGLLLRVLGGRRKGGPRFSCRPARRPRHLSSPVHSHPFVKLSSPDGYDQARI